MAKKLHSLFVNHCLGLCKCLTMYVSALDAGAAFCKLMVEGECGQIYISVLWLSSLSGVLVNVKFSLSTTFMHLPATCFTGTIISHRKDTSRTNPNSKFYWY